MRNNKKTILLVTWLALLGVLFFAITKMNGGSSGGVTPEPRPRFTAEELERRWPEITANAPAPVLGNPKTRYTLVEFGDFECPQCGRARPILESLLKQYPGQVNLLFFHRPFPNIHKFALQAAAASNAAAAQGKFWPMYNILYSHQDDLEPGYYADYASAAGLDVAKFRAAAASPQTQAAVQKDAQLADSLQIQLTPTLLLHDNLTGKVTPYVGMDSTAPGATPGFAGVKQLAANPPWQAAPKTAQK